MDFEIDTDQRDRNINYILRIEEIDDVICKKFDDVGCQYLKYRGGRLYRRNQYFYHIDYSSDYIMMFDENMEEAYYDRDEEFWSGCREWCVDCQRYYNVDTGVRRYLKTQTFFENKKVGIQEIIRLNHLYR